MEHPICWGYLHKIAEDRDGEAIYRCDKCGDYFYTFERDDGQILKEFGPEDEPWWPGIESA